jgi:hypothetical protein
MSSLYDRRLMVLLLKNYSHGRRAFTEGCRVSKMLLSNREKWYEETTQVYKNIQTKSAKPLQLQTYSQIKIPV